METPHLMTAVARHKVRFLLLLFTIFDSFLTWIDSSTACGTSEIDQHISVGMSMLAKGQYSDALLHFHAAIDCNPDDYMSYYRRATAYMAISRPRQVLADLDTVLEKKPDFHRARLLHASTLLKCGRVDEAHVEIERMLSSTDLTKNEEAEAFKLYASIEDVKQELDSIEYHAGYEQHELVINAVTAIVDNVPWYARLRKLRALAHLAVGNAAQAVADVRSEAKLTPDSTDAHLRLAELYYEMGHTSDSMTAIRECLHLDPDHSQCFKFYKKAKKVAKVMTAMQEATENDDNEAAIEAAEKILKVEPDVEGVRVLAYERLCKSYGRLDKGAAARDACTKAMAGGETADLLCDRADAYLADDMFDEASADYHRAQEIIKDFHRAAEGLKKLAQQKKQSSKRDYYKILGLKRNCKKRDVNKAYRKLAAKWHPDNFQSEAEKKQAEKKFLDIAAAKEVLSDPEKRKQYDHGHDPLDPEAGHGGGGGNHGFAFHPFGPGGFPFPGGAGGGGGRHFEFKFDFS